MKQGETISQLSARFSSICNELESLGRVIMEKDKVRKILVSLNGRWVFKVTVVQESKNISTLPYRDLIGSLMAHELYLDDQSQDEPVKNKGIALTSVSNEAASDDDVVNESMAILEKRVNEEFPLSQSKPQVAKKFKKFKNKSQVKGCFKCGDSGHIITDYLSWKNIKNKQKRSQAMKGYQKAMLSVQGCGDLDVNLIDQSDEEDDDIEE